MIPEKIKGVQVKGFTTAQSHLTTFNNLDQLKSIRLPSGIQPYLDSEDPKDFTIDLESRTLWFLSEECPNLTEINITANHQYYTSENGILFSKDKTKLLWYPTGKAGKYTIPSTVTEIGTKSEKALRKFQKVQQLFMNSKTTQLL